MWGTKTKELLAIYDFLATISSVHLKKTVEWNGWNVMITMYTKKNLMIIRVVEWTDVFFGGGACYHFSPSILYHEKGWVSCVLHLRLVIYLTKCSQCHRYFLVDQENVPLLPKFKLYQSTTYRLSCNRFLHIPRELTMLTLCCPSLKVRRLLLH